MKARYSNPLSRWINTTIWASCSKKLMPCPSTRPPGAVVEIGLDTHFGIKLPSLQRGSYVAEFQDVPALEFSQFFPLLVACQVVRFY